MTHINTTTRITPKGQVTIPKFLRDRYQLRPSDEVLWEDTGDRITVRRAVDFLEVARRMRLAVKRRFKGKKIPNVLKAREYMEKHYRRI